LNRKIILTSILSSIILLSPLAQAALSKEKLQELIAKEEANLVDFHQREQPYLKASEAGKQTTITEFVLFNEPQENNNLYSTFKVTNNSDYTITRAVPVVTLSHAGEKDRSMSTNVTNIAPHSSTFIGKDTGINKVYQSVFQKYAPSEITVTKYINIVKLDVDGLTIELTDGDTSKWRTIREYITKSETNLADYKKQLAELN